MPPSRAPQDTRARPLAYDELAEPPPPGGNPTPPDTPTPRSPPDLPNQLRDAANRGSGNDFLNALPDLQWRALMRHFNIDHHDPDAQARLVSAACRNAPQDAAGAALPPTAGRPTPPTAARVEDELRDLASAYPARSSFAAALLSWLQDKDQTSQGAVFDQFGVDPYAPAAAMELESRIWHRVGAAWNPQRITDPPPTPASPDFWTPARRALARTPVTADAPIGSGQTANDARKLAFADGTFGVFKSQGGERSGLRYGVPAGGQHRREVAASVLADAMGFGDLVPPTAYRVHGGQPGSVQRYVDGEVAAAAPGRVRYDGPTDAARAAVLDYLLGHSDRHQGNWLVVGANAPAGRLGKLALIDNGLSLPVRHFSGDYFKRTGGFQNMEFWKYASGIHDLPLPDLSDLQARWPAAEAALRDVGLEEDAIRLAKERLDVLTSGRHRTVGELPAFFRRGPGGTRPTLKQAIWGPGGP